MDITHLITGHALLALLSHLTLTSPSYNLPLFLYGLYALSHHDSPQPLKQYLLFLGVSVVGDVVWLSVWGNGLEVEGKLHFWSTTMTVLNLLAKPLSLFWTLQAYRRRGGDTYGINFGIHGRNLAGPIALGREHDYVPANQHGDDDDDGDGEYVVGTEGQRKQESVQV